MTRDLAKEREAHWREAESPLIKLLALGDMAMARGSATLPFVVRPEHLNLGGITHGGVLAAVLDVAMGAAVVTLLEEGEWCATMTLTTDFLLPSAAGDRLVSRARVDRRGKLAAYVSGDVVREGTEDVVARATGVWAIRRG